MSRSGYVDLTEFEPWSGIRYRGAVKSAMRGRRGQALLRELLDALDAMPNRRLIKKELESDGEVCGLASLGIARGIDMSDMDPNNPEEVANAFGIATSMAREIVYINDEDELDETPEERWTRFRTWVATKINLEE